MSISVAEYRASKRLQGPYGHVKDGYREDIGIYVRSSMEANFCRYLNWLKARGEIEHWEYEPRTFWFLTIKRGVRSYKPDFRVREKGKDYYIEVKGFMDAKSKTKLKRMKGHYPEIDLRLVDTRQYRAIADKVGRMIPGWE